MVLHPSLPTVKSGSKPRLALKSIAKVHRVSDRKAIKTYIKYVFANNPKNDPGKTHEQRASIVWAHEKLIPFDIDINHPLSYAETITHCLEGYNKAKRGKKPAAKEPFSKLVLSVKGKLKDPSILVDALKRYFELTRGELPVGVAAVHTDSDNDHIHAGISNVMSNGNVYNPHGWKRDSLRALSQISKEFGHEFDLAEGVDKETDEHLLGAGDGAYAAQKHGKGSFKVMMRKDLNDVLKALEKMSGDRFLNYVKLMSACPTMMIPVFNDEGGVRGLVFTTKGYNDAMSGAQLQSRGPYKAAEWLNIIGFDSNDSDHIAAMKGLHLDALEHTTTSARVAKALDIDPSKVSIRDVCSERRGDYESIVEASMQATDKVETVTAVAVEFELNLRNEINVELPSQTSIMSDFSRHHYKGWLSDVLDQWSDPTKGVQYELAVSARRLLEMLFPRPPENRFATFFFNREVSSGRQPMMFKLSDKSSKIIRDQGLMPDALMELSNKETYAFYVADESKSQVSPGKLAKSIEAKNVNYFDIKKFAEKVTQIILVKGSKVIVDLISDLSISFNTFKQNATEGADRYKKLQERAAKARVEKDNQLFDCAPLVDDDHIYNPLDQVNKQFDANELACLEESVPVEGDSDISDKLVDLSNLADAAQDEKPNAQESIQPDKRRELIKIETPTVEDLADAKKRFMEVLERLEDTQDEAAKEAREAALNKLSASDKVDLEKLPEKKLHRVMNIGLDINIHNVTLKRIENLDAVEFIAIHNRKLTDVINYHKTEIDRLSIKSAEIEKSMTIMEKGGEYEDSEYRYIESCLRKKGIVLNPEIQKIDMVKVYELEFGVDFDLVLKLKP